MEMTEIWVDEEGTETHESWLLVRASRITGTATHLFDSEIAHQYWVRVSVTRCSRRRDLKRDWLHGEQLVLEMDLSLAQWGAFVSSFGDGAGVPATLTWLNGAVSRPPLESRTMESVREVREAGTAAMSEVKEAHAKLAEAFERGAGKKEMRELMTNLKYKVENAPGNMAFAATSLTEHVENITTKARADIEAMVIGAGGDLAQFGIGSGGTRLLGGGDDA